MTGTSHLFVFHFLPRVICSVVFHHIMILVLFRELSKSLLNEWLHYFIAWNHQLIIPFHLPVDGAGFGFPFFKHGTGTINLSKLTSIFLRQGKQATGFWVFPFCTYETKSCSLILDFVLISKSLGPCNKLFGSLHNWIICGISIMRAPTSFQDWSLPSLKIFFGREQWTS